MAYEKKLEEITFKLPADMKRKLFGLTAAKGTNASDALRLMAEKFINEHKREYESMRDIFEEDDESDKA